MADAFAERSGKILYFLYMGFNNNRHDILPVLTLGNRMSSRKTIDKANDDGRG